VSAVAIGPTAVNLEYREGSGAWRPLKTLTTSARGTWTTTTTRRASRRYRLRWTAPDGTERTGPPTRSYVPAG
jgi:hypothetical protein